MSKLRLSELLPCERKALEVIHSYVGQRLSGSVSDRLVSNNFSGNATPIHSSDDSMFCSAHGFNFSHHFEYFEIIHNLHQLENPSQNCTAPSSPPPLPSVSRPLSLLHSISPSYDPLLLIPLSLLPGPMLFFLCSSSLCSQGLQASALPEAAAAKPAGAWSNW